MYKLIALVFLAFLVGCGSDDIKAGTTPTVADASPEFNPSVEIPQCPESPEPVVIGVVGPYYQTDQCCGNPIYLGLGSHGTHPSVAITDMGKPYHVTGVYEGEAWLKVGQKCLPGGSYEGYDLFTLEEW